MIALTAIIIYIGKRNSFNSRVESVLKKHWLRAVILLNRTKKPSSIKELSKEEKKMLLSLSDEEWDEWENLIRDCLGIAKDYPNAFDDLLSGFWDSIQKRDYFVKNQKAGKSRIENHDVAITTLFLDEVRLITNEPKANLEKKEERHKAILMIQKQYPKGYKSYCDNLKEGTPTDFDIIRDVNSIIELQKVYEEHNAFRGWEKRQETFCATYRNILDEVRAQDGKYIYDVPYQKISLSGLMDSSHFKIWQGFREHYSNCMLDKQIDSFRKKHEHISLFRNRTRYFVDRVYDGLFEVISRIDSAIDGDTLTVFVTRNSLNWSSETFDYHYQHLRKTLNETEHPWCNINELFDLKEKEQYKAVLVIDFITSNQELRNNSGLVIESFKKKIPLIGYYSLFKEYDQDELLELKNLLKSDKPSKPKKVRVMPPSPPEFNDDEEIAYIKNLLSQIVKHPFYTYLALPNALVGEAVGAEETKKRWIDNPERYGFKTKDYKGKIGGEFTCDGERTWHDLVLEGDTFNIDDVAHYTFLLFKAMGLLGQFRKKGANAVAYMNQMGYLATH